MQALRARRRAADRRAQAYNEAHPDACRALAELTRGQLGDLARSTGLGALRAWQRAHGLPTDGCVGPHTLAAARAEAGGEVRFAEAEEPAIVATAPRPGGAGLAAAVVAEGDTDALEDRDGSHADETDAAPDGPESARADDETKEHGSGMKEAVEHGVGGRAGAAVSWVALVPALVELLRAHHYREAVAYVAKNVGYEERVELLREAAARLAERHGYALAPRLLGVLEKAALAGAVADVLALGWEWTTRGLDAIRQAHEQGARDSRIAIYAYAWSDTVMGNRHQNPGAVDEEQRAAMSLGIEDGRATLERSPELGGLLCAEYGDADHARRALEDALLRRSGLIGVTSHVGR